MTLIPSRDSPNGKDMEATIGPDEIYLGERTTMEEWKIFSLEKSSLRERYHMS